MPTDAASAAHPDRLETRFPDGKPPLTHAEAVLEARRCLYCYDAPCTQACPTAVDVPSFIRKISTGNLRGAARTILSANLLGASCARVCPVEVLCEGACVYVPWGRRPIEIGRLQRFAMEKAASPDLLAKAPRSGHSIGLVGAGPASLACAGRLALHGHEAILYERDELPGGLNTTGIAPYKLQLPDALAEIERIRALGVEIRTGVEVGRNLTAAEMLDRHELVFLGPGLGRDMFLGIPGEEGPGVVGAIDWIRRLKTDPSLSLDGIRDAVVIGGGNTAVDVARELAGLGVDSVRIVYRRSQAVMKAYPHELARARQEGVVLIEKTVVSEVLREGATIRAVRCVEADDGRATERVRCELLAQLVVLAIGQGGARPLAERFPGVTCDARGRIEVDPETGLTRNPRVFAGGDAVNGGKEVVNAVQAGQVAARTIDSRLRRDVSRNLDPGGGADG